MNISRRSLVRPRAANLVGFAFVVIVGVVDFVFPHCVGGAQEQTAFSVPYRTAQMELVDTKNFTAPIYSNGHIIRFHRLPEASENANILIWSESGKLEQAIRAWPKSATKLFITSVDVSRDSTLVYAGEATYANGASSAFIAVSRLDGTSLRSFGTASYLATQVSVAGDGTIWAVGAEKFEALRGLNGIIKRWNNYDVLRRFNSSGEVIDHLLPRWGTDISYTVERVDASGERTLVAYDHGNRRVTEFHAPFWGYTGGFVGPSSIENQIWLRASADGVVLFDGRSGLLWQYTSATRLLISAGVDIRAQGDRMLNGFAISGSGKIYGSLQYANPEIQNMVGLYELRRKIPQELYEWCQVPGPIGENGQGFHPDRLLGSDGESLIFSVPGRQVVWSEIGGEPGTDK